MNPEVERLLFLLSALIMMEAGHTDSLLFDRLFEPEGFKYNRAREAYVERDKNFPLSILRKLRNEEPGFTADNLLEQLVRSGYPDYALKAQEFLRANTPEVLHDRR